MHKTIRRESANAEKAVVFIHGFMGSPNQFTGLADAAYHSGCSCISILLPGHGTDVQEFVHVRADDWQTAVQRELSNIKDRYDQIFLVGHSMGGLLALQASLIRENHISGVLLIATPLKLHPLNPKSIMLKFRFLRLSKDHEIRQAYQKTNSIVNFKPRDFLLMARPFLHVYRLARKTRKILHKIFVPVYLFHSTHDETTAYQNAKLFLNGLRNTRVAAFPIHKSWHAFYDAEEWGLIQEKMLEMIGVGMSIK